MKGDDKGLLGSSPETSKAGVAVLLVGWMMAILRFVMALTRDEIPTDHVIESAAIAVISLILYFGLRKARDNSKTSKEAGAE